MATKISINIDLTHSKRVHPHDEPVTHLTKKTPINEYKYRYDRIFVLFIIIFITIAISLYLILSLPKSDDENITQEAPQAKPIQAIIIKEKHLSVPAPVPQKPHQYLVYLFYEEINVLETFKFPLKKQITEVKKAAPLSPEKIVKKEIIIEPPAKTPIKKQPEQIKEVNNDFININSKNLSRVLLVSNIYKKEPVNELSDIVTGKEDKAEKIYLFTQIDNSLNQSIEHQWWYDGEIRHKRKFKIRGKRWRCYSSKNIGKLQQGEWLIKVVDENKNLLAIVNFQYQVE